MRTTVGVSVCLLIGAMMAGCDDFKRVSASEFQAMLARNPESMRHTDFIGQRGDKAYLRVSTMSTLNPERWTEELLVTDAEELPKEWLLLQKRRLKPGGVAPCATSVEQETHPR